MSPESKGAHGEAQVTHLINQHLNMAHYHLINDITLPAGDGTTQIDHVLVSVYGVFVIETKNMNGWIFGKERDKNWTQKLNRRHSQSFQNPLRQNHKHVKTLQDILGLDAEQLHSMVVFVGGCKFKTAMPAQVTRGKGCIHYIQSKSRPVMFNPQLRHAIETIEAVRHPRSRKTAREHVRYVNSIKQ